MYVSISKYKSSSNRIITKLHKNYLFWCIIYNNTKEMKLKNSAILLYILVLRIKYEYKYSVELRSAFFGKDIKNAFFLKRHLYMLVGKLKKQNII